MEKTIKDGIICVFDILGYKNFLQNNSIYECAENIKNIITKIPEEVENQIAELFNNLIDKTLKEKTEIFLKNNFHHINVSDSILLVFDLSDIMEDRDYFTFYAFMYARFFHEISFKKGFPMRGCIDIGSFYSYNNIFAGNTIVNSFQESENMNISGLIISENAIKIIEEKGGTNSKRFIELWVSKYIIPLKNNVEGYKNLIEWGFNLIKNENTDVKQVVFESFHAHKKEVNLSVMEKINNTEKILRFFIMKYRK